MDGTGLLQAGHYAILRGTSATFLTVTEGVTGAASPRKHEIGVADMTFAGAIPSAKASQRHWERAAEGWDAHSLALRAWLTEAT
jgi:hypothetical protein